MSSNDVLAGVRNALETIADALDGASFVVPSEARENNETMRLATVDTIRQYLLHRLREPDAPVVAVLVGLSGVGKSTILNSLAQEAVAATGVVRPTTKTSVLWAHKDHAARYWTEFVGRVRDHIGATTDVVIGEDTLTQFLTFVDTPPLGLEPEDGSLGADQTLMFADICIFVTSAERYADGAPLQFLDSARARGIPILFVLNNLPADGDERKQMLDDYANKLVAAGLLPEPDPGFIFGVDRVDRPRWHGGLGAEHVAALRKELSEVSDPEFRLVVVDETAEATLMAVADRAGQIADALQVEQSRRARLWSDVAAAYEPAEARLREDLGSGDFAEMAEAEVWSQAAVDLVGVVTLAAGGASETSARAWESREGGIDLIEPNHEGLRRHGADTARTARESIDGWRQLLGGLASVQRRPPRRKRKMRRVESELWRCVLDPGREARWWKGDRAAAVAEARAMLGDVISNVLGADAARFARRLAPEADAAAADDIRAAIRYLSDVSGPVAPAVAEEGLRGR